MTMYRRNQNNQICDVRELRKISRVLTMPTDSLLSEELPELDDFSLKTLSSTTGDSSKDSIESHSTSYMRLRSKVRYSINPFDLSSDCGDNDFFENKYSLRSKRKHVDSKLSSTGEFSKKPLCIGDLESMRWSGIHSFVMSEDLHNMCECHEDNALDNKFMDPFDKDKHKRPSVVGEHEDSEHKKPKTFCYELRQRNRNIHNLSNHPSPLPILRDSSTNNIYIPEISNQTLYELLIGRYSCYLSDYSIIDCRFPYEYEGGHINKSTNLYTCRQLMQYICKPPKSSPPDIEQELHQVLKLLESPNSVDDNSHSKAFIFYCEFSSFRAPKLAQCLRGLDRMANVTCHPRLKFPHVYVLRGGFNEFYTKYPHLCTPEGYISMKQTRYALRSPINPCLATNSPTKYYTTSESDSTKMLHFLTPKITDEEIIFVHRKQQINCQRQLRTDAKRLAELVMTSTKNSDIIRLFKIDELF